MSFEQQERALFDLLFNSSLREQFCQQTIDALKDYGLSEAELNDFKSIRPEALQLDAAMRADLILSQLCKAFPISFCISSSIENGLGILAQLIDSEMMMSKPVERTMAFGQRLREQYAHFGFSSEKEQQMAAAFLEAELGMAWLSVSLKQMVLENGFSPELDATLGGGWSEKPIKLAANVGAALIPRSYAQLKKELYTVTEECLWRYLNDSPLSVSLRKRALAKEDPRLLVTRACISRLSPCEPAVEFITIELSEGFAPLLQHVDGSMSISHILGQLRQIGAEEDMLESIQSVFRQLLENKMIELA